MADWLALIGFVKPSRRIVNVRTASIVAAVNRLRKRATGRFYPVCCGSHRNFVNWTFRGIWHGDLLRTEEMGTQHITNFNRAVKTRPASGLNLRKHPPIATSLGGNFRVPLAASPFVEDAGLAA
jgi:hypothetical protein